MPVTQPAKPILQGFQQPKLQSLALKSGGHHRQLRMGHKGQLPFRQPHVQAQVVRGVLWKAGGEIPGYRPVGRLGQQDEPLAG